MTHLKIVSFTQGGAVTATKLAQALSGTYLIECYARGCDLSLAQTGLKRFAQQAMYDCNALVFIGAAGIAIRAVAPHLRGKTMDPAVLVMDEAGHHIIPLLSGHIGGANALALQVQQAIGAEPILTTATDVREIFAVDTWACAHHFAILEPAQIRNISAALLREELVGFLCDFPMKGTLPAGLIQDQRLPYGIVVSCHVKHAPFPHTLHLVPRLVVAGIGCRRGKSEKEILDILNTVLHMQGIPHEALCCVASIDLKQEEPGMQKLCATLGVPFKTYPAAQLKEVPGVFSGSAFVQRTTGVDNVCERAAVRASGGTLLCEKYARDGVTIALAISPMEVDL